MPETIWKPRELEILHHLAQGHTDREIAAKMHLAYETIRWYNKQIYSKLGVSNRIQAVQLAARLGLFDEGTQARRIRNTISPAHRSDVQYVLSGDVHIAY